MDRYQAVRSVGTVHNTCEVELVEVESGLNGSGEFLLLRGKQIAHETAECGDRDRDHDSDREDVVATHDAVVVEPVRWSDLYLSRQLSAVLVIGATVTLLRWGRTSRE